MFEARSIGEGRDIAPVLSVGTDRSQKCAPLVGGREGTRPLKPVALRGRQPPIRPVHRSRQHIPGSQRATERPVARVRAWQRILRHEIDVEPGYGKLCASAWRRCTRSRTRAARASHWRSLDQEPNSHTHNSRSRSIAPREKRVAELSPPPCRDRGRGRAQYRFVDGKVQLVPLPSLIECDLSAWYGRGFCLFVRHNSRKTRVRPWSCGVWGPVCDRPSVPFSWRRQS
jgi:hypothetical protein